MAHHYAICQCKASKPRCGGSCPIPKTFCWRSAQGLDHLVAPSQIVHSEGASVHPMYHGLKQHPPHPSNSLEITKKPCFLVSHVEGLFHLQDINLECKFNNWHGNHLAQWNMHPHLALWGDLVLFKNLPYVVLCSVLHHLDCLVEWQSIILHLNCEAWKLLEWKTHPLAKKNMIIFYVGYMWYQSLFGV